LSSPNTDTLPGKLQQRNQRKSGRWIAIVLLLTLLLIALILGHSSALLWAELSWSDFVLLLRLGSLLVVVLVAIAGIYSLVSQFAFWEGWLKGLPRPAEFFAQANQELSQSLGPPAVGVPSPYGRYLVYLDGIHQVQRDHPPLITEFLDTLEAGLPAHTCLVRGLETYTVMPGALIDDVGSTWFWQRVFALQEHHRSWLVQLLCAVLIQGNNVIKVGISSDRRYGPILNYELALKISLRLGELGYVPGRELVLLGYSGGGEMALGVADYLRRICHAPVRIVTCCGVFSGNQVLEGVESIHMLVGSRDPVASLGPLAYPGRSPLLPLSNWNKAKRQGFVQQVRIPGMSHNGSIGPFAPKYRLKVIQAILAILEGSIAEPAERGWNSAGTPEAFAGHP
jgi:hypothetical protein